MTAVPITAITRIWCRDGVVVVMATGVSDDDPPTLTALVSFIGYN